MAKDTVSFSGAGTEGVSDIGCWRSKVGTIFTEIGGRRSASQKSGTGPWTGGDCVAAGQPGNCVLFGRINGRGVATNSAYWTWDLARQATGEEGRPKHQKNRGYRHVDGEQKLLKLRCQSVPSALC
ncbi:hypothetical protein ColTof4_10318 [Colletotrichum tofieldiae]|nr:hypothetical protein ColTof4_10318 [Colletotrichum tofieldiae]GKT84796.1 hypothetical protein Ct61P_02646 [Colletotrichum tofieldiae]